MKLQDYSGLNYLQINMESIVLFFCIYAFNMASISFK